MATTAHRVVLSCIRAARQGADHESLQAWVCVSLHRSAWHDVFSFWKARARILMDCVFLRRIWEGVGKARGSCAGAHRGVLCFGHFLGREGLLDESLWSRDPHLLEKRGDWANADTPYK